ncbi:MAG: helix-hairpin-helix domain-containing protein [Sphingobacteriales bacterium]|nr:helix-hairpin-helix domain-containing protein [Sphingobacteriales bacterium]
MQKKEQHQLLSFSKKEKNGIIVIVFINLLLIFTPFIYERLFPEKEETAVDLISELKALEEIQKDSVKHYGDNMQWSDENQHQVETQQGQRETKTELFHFNPNVITEREWMKLGVSEKTAKSIQKYISKGGQFRKPEDIKKIWGIPESLANKLIPFVQIPETKEKYEKEFYKKNERAVNLIDINKADSTTWESLPGIGPTLAKRIILYRDKLGGFLDMSQLLEVWGLQDSVLQKSKNRLVLGGEIKKININLASFEALKTHPYIGYKSANAIINYRNQHGNFNRLEDIQKIVQIDEKTYNRFVVYLTIKQ